MFFARLISILVLVGLSVSAQSTDQSTIVCDQYGTFYTQEDFVYEQAIRTELRISECPDLPSLPFLNTLFKLSVRFNATKSQEGGLVNATENLIAAAQQVLASQLAHLTDANRTTRNAILVNATNSLLEILKLDDLVKPSTVKSVLNRTLSSFEPYADEAVEALNTQEYDDDLREILNELSLSFKIGTRKVEAEIDGGLSDTILVRVANALNNIQKNRNHIIEEPILNLSDIEEGQLNAEDDENELIVLLVPVLSQIGRA